MTRVPRYVVTAAWDRSLIDVVWQQLHLLCAQVELDELAIMPRWHCVDCQPLKMAEAVTEVRRSRHSTG